MVGIGLSPYVDFRIAMIALVGYLLLGNLVYILTYIRNEFQDFLCWSGSNRR